MPFDAILIGGGHNSLTTAFYLAKAGRKPLVLERRDVVGGAAVSEEIAPGFTCSTLSHATGPVRQSVIDDMRLAQHGLELIRPDPRVFAPAADGRALALYDDPAQSARAIAAFSAQDAQRFTDFHRTLVRMGAIFTELASLTPPSLDDPSASDMWSLLKVGRRFRALGRRDEFRLLRWAPMAVADLVAEWFETDVLRAVVAARGIFGSFLGPWSAGSGAALLLQSAWEPHSAGPATFVRGGLGALSRAMASAARQAGAEIRTDAEVTRIMTVDGTAVGVVLANGEEIAAPVVVSGADPKRTLLGLVDPVDLDPDFLLKMRNYRCQGVTAKVNLALGALPEFSALASLSPSDRARQLSGRIHIGPGIDYLERAFDAAKYGTFSQQPYFDVTIPSLTDPSLAPAGRHVMSVYMQYAPFSLRAGDWDAARDALGDTVVNTLAAYAPGIEQLIVHRQVITPKDLETRYGLTGGHIFHGEHALDQIFTMRPLLGWARYSTPIAGLYLCGAGTHPGGGVTAGPGANAAREILTHARS